MHTQAPTDRDRGCGDEAANWECPVAATESWERQGTDSALETPKEVQLL